MIIICFFVDNHYKQLSSEQRIATYPGLPAKDGMFGVNGLSRNIAQNKSSGCISTPEADGSRFGDWELDLIVGKGHRGTLVAQTERLTTYTLMEYTSLTNLKAKSCKLKRKATDVQEKTQF